MKFSKIYKCPINPYPDRHNPKNQNEPKTEKRPFCVRFLKEQKTDVFTKKAHNEIFNLTFVI